jgi:hypothetical protein
MKNEREYAPNELNGSSATHATDPEPPISTERVEGTTGLLHKRSHRDQFTTSSGVLRATKTSTTHLTANPGLNKDNIRSRRTGNPDDGNQDTTSTAAATCSTKPQSRAMQRPLTD